MLFFEIHIVSIVSSVLARKLKNPSSAWLEPENSSSNSSLVVTIDQVGRALRHEIISCWNWMPQRNSNTRAALHKFAGPKICHLVKVLWLFCCSAIFVFLLLFDIFPAKDMKYTIATIFLLLIMTYYDCDFVSISLLVSTVYWRDLWNVSWEMNVPSETILPCCSLHHPSTKQKIAPRKMGWAGQKWSSLAKWGHKFSEKGIHIPKPRAGLDSKSYLNLHSKHFIDKGNHFGKRTACSLLYFLNYIPPLQYLAQ